MLGSVLLDNAAASTGDTASVLLIGQAHNDFSPADFAAELTRLVPGIGGVDSADLPGDAGERSFDVVWILDPEPPPTTVLAAAELVGTTGRLIWSAVNGASVTDTELSGEGLRAQLGTYGLSAQHSLFPWPRASNPTFVFSHEFLQHGNRLAALASVIESAQPLGWTDVDCSSGDLSAVVGSHAAPELFATTISIAAVDPATRDGDSAQAWAFARVGLDLWSAVHTFGLTSQELTRRTHRIDEAQGRPELGWLSLNTGVDQSIPTGPAILDEVLSAFRAGDSEAAAAVLKRWRGQLSDQVIAGSQVGPVSPFGEASGDHLPGRFVDARLSNVAAEPELGLLAPNWHVAGDVTLEIVETRGLWDLAHYLVTSGAAHPWPSEASIDDLTQSLGALCGIAIGPDRLSSWRVAESALCARLFGGDDGDYVAHLTERSGASRLDMVDSLPSPAAADLVGELRERVDTGAVALQVATARAVELEDQLSVLRSQSNARIEDLEWDLSEVTRDRDRLADKVDAQSMLTSEVLRKYERAVHERNMIEQGMNGYRQAVGVAKRVLPSQAYFKVRKIVRGH